MSWTAKFEHNEWVFYSGDVVIFSSEDMSEHDARKIVAAVNSHDALADIANDLWKALSQFQDYDAAFSHEKVEAIAKKAEPALALASPRVQRTTVIGG